MKDTVVRIASFTLLGLLLMTGVAAPHSPIFLPDSKKKSNVHEWRVISDPERSWAIYGRIATEASADVVPIAARQGQQLYLQTLVPQQEALKLFRPMVVLIGPGLTGVAPPDLPIPLAPGEGTLVVPDLAEPKPLFEGFTQIRYWVYGTVTGIFPVTGRYKLLIYDPAGTGGPYTIALGIREQFGLLDVLTFPLVWVRAHLWLWK